MGVVGGAVDPDDVEPALVLVPEESLEDDVAPSPVVAAVASLEGFWSGAGFWSGLPFAGAAAGSAPVGGFSLSE
ncbi:MAG: hypothetical protein ACREKF_09955 [Candidatus Methylomirabilales bacterium]